MQMTKTAPLPLLILGRASCIVLYPDPCLSHFFAPDPLKIIKYFPNVTEE
jgi:hypothetical protein